MLNLKTASTIAASIVHAKLDYCNSFLLNIDATQINHHQAIQNALIRAATKTKKDHHITAALKTLYWLKIPEQIEYKVYHSHSTNLNPLSHPTSVSCSTFSFNVFFFCPTLLCTSVTSSLKLANRSIAIVVPPLWNKLFTSCYLSTALSLQTVNTGL